MMSKFLYLENNDMFKHLFDNSVQSLTTSWALFLQKYGEVGRNFRDDFYFSVYPFAGIILIIFSLLSCVIYYYYMNSHFGDNYLKRTYIFTLVVNSFVIGLTTFIRTSFILNKFSCPTGTHIFSITLINSLFGGILFIIMSCILKWNSPMGKRTPF